MRTHNICGHPSRPVVSSTIIDFGREWTFIGKLVVTALLFLSLNLTYGSAVGATLTLSDIPSMLEPFPGVAASLPAWAYSDPLDVASPPETAVYDISAHVVVMPDGARLEAHSGLRDRVDEPRFVSEHMRGSTPPALYDLVPRRGLFHGIAALRLKPISGNVFGRRGLLAHPYMLGGRPESNGCVVFRDYPTFLGAFREGHVKYLRVVPGLGEAALRTASRAVYRILLRA